MMFSSLSSPNCLGRISKSRKRASHWMNKSHDLLLLFKAVTRPLNSSPGRQWDTRLESPSFPWRLLIFATIGTPTLLMKGNQLVFANSQSLLTTMPASAEAARIRVMSVMRPGRSLTRMLYLLRERRNPLRDCRASPMLHGCFWLTSLDRKSVVEGKSVDLGGRRIIKKKKKV